MNYLYHKGKFYEYSEHWNELTGKQLLGVTAVLNSDVSLEVGKVQLLLILLRWNAWKLLLACGFHRLRYLSAAVQYTWLPKRLGRWLDNTERLATAAEEITAFLFAENNLTVQLLPQVKGLYGPASSLANLRMAEFCYSEFYFLQWKEKNQLADLNLLVATLYRPGKRKEDFADRRIPFDPASIEHLAAKIDCWPLHTKLAIASWYHGAREEKISQNKPVFEYEGGDDDSSSLYGLWSVMRSVAKAGHFGTFEQVGNEYVDTILMELHESIVEYEKQKEHLENLKLQNND